MQTLPAHLLAQPRLSRFLWETFKQNKAWAILTFLLRCAGLADNIIWPLFIKLATDELVVAYQVHVINWATMGWIMVVGVVGWFMGDLADAAAGIISARKLATIRAEVRLFALDDMYRQSQQFFHDRFAGSIGTSLRDLSESVSDILNEIVYQLLPAFVLFLGLCIIFAKVDWRYLVLLSIWTCLQVGLIFSTRGKALAKNRVYADRRSELVGKLIDSISNHLSITSFAARKGEHAQILDVERIVADRRADAVRYNQFVNLMYNVLEVVFVFSGFVMVYFYLFGQGRATVGDFMFMIQGIYGLMRTVKEISKRVFWFYEQSGIGQEAIAKILTPHTVLDASDAKDLHITDAKIHVENLSFEYRAGTPVLQDLNFTVVSGEKIGLVGYSGSGKTTLVNLLLRFYDLTDGRITIDGQDIKSVTQDSLRRAIAFIPQDTSLFHRTLKDNIRIARPDASDDDIVAAAKLAGAHDFIAAQLHGYDTLVGERGVKLSGGQRQRVAIARAFLKAAPILILDEATSALDSVTEHAIQDALDHVMQGRTTLVIAHRLSTLRQMDRILVFDHGRIVEQGTHDELLAHINGRYAKMWAMQAGGFLPEREDDTTA